jgi:hypothetical protein
MPKPVIPSDLTITRRLLAFLRARRIPYNYSYGILHFGSSVAHIRSGCVCVFFPAMSSHYSQAVNYSVVWVDCFSSYLRIAALHNAVVTAFPMALYQKLPEID